MMEMSKSFFLMLLLMPVSLFTMAHTHSHLQEDRIYQRFLAADSTLTTEELSTMYRAYTSTEAYRNSLQEELPTDSIGQAQLRPLSVRALYRAALHCKKRGDRKLSEMYAWRQYMLGEMITHTAEGTAASPYYLIYLEDVHTLLFHWLSIDSIIDEEQEGNICIIRCAMPPDWNDFFYFDLSASLAITNP